MDALARRRTERTRRGKSYNHSSAKRHIKLLEQSVKEAVDHCIDNGILADFLKEHKGEVIKSMTEEIILMEAIKVWSNEDREEEK